MMKCSFCGSIDQKRTMIQGSTEETLICENCIEIMHDMVIKQGIKNQTDLKKASKSNKKEKSGSSVDFTKFQSTGLNVRLIEFFRLEEEPNQDKGDWDDQFAVWNYFIPEVSIKAFNDQIYISGDKTFYTIEDLKIFLEESLKDKIYYNGDPLPGDVLEGLIRTAISGENDVDEVTEYFPDSNIEIIEEVDDLSSDYSNTLGCRVWSFDVPEGKIDADNLGYKINLSKVDAENIDDYIQSHEDEAVKTMVIVRAYFS